MLKVTSLQSYQDLHYHAISGARRLEDPKAISSFPVALNEMIIIIDPMNYNGFPFLHGDCCTNVYSGTLKYCLLMAWQVVTAVKGPLKAVM